MNDAPDIPVEQSETERAQASVTICNQRGLHARAAARFVKMVENRSAKVTVEKDGNSVCGTSIMGLLMLSASKDTVINIKVEGARAQDILQELVMLVESKFDEEC